MATLSIIIPVYNKEEYLDACIQSILGQTYQDFELILVNDGSTDKSGEKCDSYKQKDERITVLHQVNMGVSAARNAGLAIAAGRYIGFSDSDDLLESDMYEVLINDLNRTGADIAMCGVRKVYADGERLFYGTQNVRLFNQDEAIKALLLDQFLGSVYDKVYKADLIKGLQFEGRMYEDFYFNFLALLRSNQTVFDDVIKYHWTIRENSVSMAHFSEKFMETVDVSGKILDRVKKNLHQHLEEAKAFDFHMNMWLLNMILFTSETAHTAAYRRITGNLQQYRSFAARSKLVKKKYKYAYYMFNVSPLLYKTVIRLYSRLTGSELEKRS